MVDSTVVTAGIESPLSLRDSMTAMTPLNTEITSRDHWSLPRRYIKVMLGRAT
jgi:hypothetical protein